MLGRAAWIRTTILLLIFDAIPALHQPVWAETEKPSQLQQGATPLQPVLRPDDDLLILEVRLGSFILSEGMIGYLTASGLLLPLGDFTRALDFPIVVEPENGRADGWFLREERIFSLDVARREVIVEAQRKSYPATLVELHEDDIFVDTRLLSRWLPVDVRFNLPNLTVNIISREPLPLEQRLEREKIRGKALSRHLADQPKFPRSDIPYQPVSWPFIDTSIDSSYIEDEDGEKTMAARYSTLLSGDLAYMSAKIFLTGNDRDELTDARLTLSRKDPDGKLLGPMALTEIELGDVAGPQLPLISRSKFGRGVTVSSFPLDRSSEFDRITIRGELPLGWEAELYRNEVLLDFQRSRADGRYEFIDVPLVFGLNALRVVLFGPQGQSRQDNRRILVGPGLVAPGEWNMRAGVSQQDKDLLPAEDDTIDVENELEGDARFLAEVEHGITQGFSVGAGFSSLPLDSGRRHYGNLSTRLALGSAYSRLDLVGDSEGGRGANVALQSRLPGGVNLSAEHGEFRDFISEQIDDSIDTLKSRSKLRLDGVVSPGGSLRVPVTLEALLDRHESGRKQAEINNRLSTSLAGVSLSNDLRASLLRGGGNDNSTTVSGDFLVGGWLANVSLRGQLGYNLVSDTEITDVSFTGEWLIEKDFTTRFGVNRQISEPSGTIYTVGLSRIFEFVSLGANLDYEDDGSMAARLSMSFALGREPRKGTWQIGSRPIANAGAVSARVFLDNNNNGEFEADEDTPLEGVEFDADQGGRDRTTTNAEGIALLTGLTPNRHSGVAVSEGTLEDPYWISQIEGVTIVPRPGIVAEVDFPIVATGEIDGTVYQMIGSSNQEVSDVTIQLIDPDGEVVKMVRSAFDGFYLFDFVPPGRYRVRIDPEQMARLNLAPPPPTDIVIGANQNVASGNDFLVRRLPLPDGGTAIAEAAEEPMEHKEAADTIETTPAEPPQRVSPQAADEASPQTAEEDPPKATDEVLPKKAGEVPLKAADTVSAGATPDASAQYWVQVGAYRDWVLGRITWRKKRKKLAPQLSDSDEIMLRRDLGPRKGVWYYFRVGPFTDMTGANQRCADLKDAGVDCFALKTIGAADTAIAARSTGPSRPPSFRAIQFLINGEAVVSGVAPAHWDVIVITGTSENGHVGANAQGRWKWIPKGKFDPGVTRLRVFARSPDGEIIASRTDFLVVVPDQDDPDDFSALDKQPVTVAVPQDAGGPARIVSQLSPAAGPATKPVGLTIELVEYDTQGNFRIAGRAPAGARLRVLVGGAALSQAAATKDGNWRVSLQGPREPGRKMIAVEHVDASGNLIGRTEVPLTHSVSTAPALPPGSISVEPGEDLWHVARRVYGQGVLYTIIYGFNAERIEDPDAIRSKTRLTAPGAE